MQGSADNTARLGDAPQLSVNSSAKRYGIDSSPQWGALVRVSTIVPIRVHLSECDFAKRYAAPTSPFEGRQELLHRGYRCWKRGKSPLRSTPSPSR